MSQGQSVRHDPPPRCRGLASNRACIQLVPWIRQHDIGLTGQRQRRSLTSIRSGPRTTETGQMNETVYFAGQSLRNY